MIPLPFCIMPQNHFCRPLSWLILTVACRPSEDITLAWTLYTRKIASHVIWSPYIPFKRILFKYELQGIPAKKLVSLPLFISSTCFYIISYSFGDLVCTAVKTRWTKKICCCTELITSITWRLKVMRILDFWACRYNHPFKKVPTCIFSFFFCHLFCVFFECSYVFYPYPQFGLRCFPRLN